VEVLDTEDFGKILAVNGRMALTEGEGFAQREMLVHVPMGVHPNVHSVLVAGGRDCGVALELLRYPQIERIVVVENDEALLGAQQKFFPELAASLADPRVRLEAEDPEDFARECKDRFDLVIVQAGEKDLGQSFYCDCFRLLSGDGILVAPAGSAFYVAQRRELVSAAGKLKRLFPTYRLYRVESPAIESGERLIGFASKKYDPLRDYDSGRWAKRDIVTRYYNGEVHKAAFALPPYVEQALQGC
jgi:Spermidine synthase